MEWDVSNQSLPLFRTCACACTHTHSFSLSSSLSKTHTQSVQNTLHVTLGKRTKQQKETKRLQPEKNACCDRLQSKSLAPDVVLYAHQMRKSLATLVPAQVHTCWYYYWHLCHQIITIWAKQWAHRGYGHTDIYFCPTSVTQGGWGRPSFPPPPTPTTNMPTAVICENNL